MSRTRRRTIKVGLVQISLGVAPARPRRPNSTPHAPAARAAAGGRAFNLSLLPYSVGLLQSYAQSHLRNPERYEFLLPVYKAIGVEEAARQLRGAQVIGFSTYVWNIRHSLAIARAVKRDSPGTLIVCGGPQVPDRAEEFLRQNPFVDIVCHGEGEAVFTAVLEKCETRDWEELSGVSYLRADGRFVSRPKPPRMKDLSEIPSPYLSGVFDPLMAAHPNESWIITWETNRGCPFACTFCDWGSAVASKVYRFEMERLLAEIEWFARRRIGFVFCCDANFGILPRDLDLAEHLVETRRQYGFPFSFSLQNTKNATERSYRIQKILAGSLNTHGVTISLQSLDPETLRSIKRDNISSESFQELQRRYTKDGVYTYTDLILGLPGETYAAFAEGVSQVIENGQHNHIQFHNCSVLPNAEMGDPEYQKKHGMVTVAQEMKRIHSSLEEEDEVAEYLDLVVATDRMPPAEWVRAKVFAWMTDFLYFDRVLQIPLVLLRELGASGYRDMLEAFCAAKPERYPVIAEIVTMFAAKAKDIQEGGAEYFPSAEWLGAWWPADQFAIIRLVAEGRLGAFYTEAEELLAQLTPGRPNARPRRALSEAVRLNMSLLKVPFEPLDLEIELTHNVWEFYRGVLAGVPVPLEAVASAYRVERSKAMWLTLDDWCEHLTWCHNKDKRGYLYPVREAERPDRAALAGRQLRASTSRAARHPTGAAR